MPTADEPGYLVLRQLPGSPLRAVARYPTQAEAQREAKRLVTKEAIKDSYAYVVQALNAFTWKDRQ